MKVDYDEKFKFKKGDILEVKGEDSIEFEVAEDELVFRDHTIKNTNINDYCYWHGPAYQRMKGSADQGRKVFLKLTLKSMPTGVRKLEKERGFCVDHPYVERVYGLYDVSARDIDGNPESFKALVCEYIKGTPMCEYYVKVKRIDGVGIEDRNEEILLFRYFFQLMQAVKFYSEQSYTATHSHRDLKPDNIIIRDREKRIVVIDFDFAHVPNLLTMSFLPHTPFAMPEGVECENIQRDIHALGWTFLFCLTGQIHNLYQDNGRENYYTLEREYLTDTASRYLEEDYSELIRIIQKMIAHPAFRDAYTSIDDLIHDYLKFLKSYVRGEDELKEVLAATELLLQPLYDELDEDDKHRVRIWYKSDKGRDLRDELSNFATRYYSFDEDARNSRPNLRTAHICIQNVNGELHYLILDDKVETDADKKAYLLKTGDRFWRDNDGVTIKVIKLGGDIKDGQV